jgi:hypothetical protein
METKENGSDEMDVEIPSEVQDPTQLQMNITTTKCFRALSITNNIQIKNV